MEIIFWQVEIAIEMNLTVIIFSIFFALLTLAFMHWVVEKTEESKSSRFFSLLIIIGLTIFWYQILSP